VSGQIVGRTEGRGVEGHAVCCGLKAKPAHLAASDAATPSHTSPRLVFKGTGIKPGRPSVVPTTRSHQERRIPAESPEESLAIEAGPSAPGPSARPALLVAASGDRR